MSLLREIQSALMEEGSGIGPILLKLRFLASRLGSDVLEEWVKHESEGYPSGSEVPDYRRISISYTGDFLGPFSSALRNAPIPGALISKFCGEHWIRYSIRESISSVDELISGDGDSLQIDASNLILGLQGKVYEDYSCNSVTGSFPKSALKALQYAVRSKILELTIELEKNIPSSVDVVIGKIEAVSSDESRAVTQITQQVFHGNYTSITNNGAGANISVNVLAGDKTSFAGALTEAGVPTEEAQELAEIVATEEPDSPDEPWGAKAKAWLARNAGKAWDGTWKVSGSVLTSVLTDAAKRYYGL